ncbi:hypothetical protein CN440_19740 [Bacillus cereus]|nr:hypothetical protein CN440_19740 [Bacillus cereus]
MENKINQNKLVQILKVMSPSTVNRMSNRDIKKINIETLAKVSDYFLKTILGNFSDVGNHVER